MLGHLRQPSRLQITKLKFVIFLEMILDDEEEDTVEPSVALMSEKGFVAETPCYGFEEDEEEENDEEVDDDNEQKIDTVRDNKRKRLTVSNNSKKLKNNIIIEPCVTS